MDKKQDLSLKKDLFLLKAVWYKNKYNNDGSGCVSFVDVDGKQYLYTQF
jgi:hypothetical protein